LDEKRRYGLWACDEVIQLADDNYELDDCKCRSDYIEKAIRFYTGYLHAKKALDYLPDVLGDILTARLDMFGDRMGKLLFKYAVESNISNHILAADTDIDLETYDKLRARSVREVRETNGSISFKDDVKFQKGL
jgi:hypothetical protein